MTQQHPSHLKTILIVIGCLLVAGAISYGTFMLLTKINPNLPGMDTPNDQSSSTPAEQATGPDADRIRAEQFLKDGKLDEAKKAYQTAVNGYTDAGNVAAAADAKQQIAIIDATLASQANQEPAPKQEDNPRQAGSAQ